MQKIDCRNCRFPHISVKESLLWDLSRPSMASLRKVYMQFAVDGVSPSRSGRDNCWLIAARIMNVKIRNCLLVSGWQGRGKPDLHKFVKRMVDDMLDLQRNGLIHPQTGMFPL